MKNGFSLFARSFLLGCEDQVLDFEDKEFTIAKIEFWVMNLSIKAKKSQISTSQRANSGL